MNEESGRKATAGTGCLVLQPWYIGEEVHSCIWHRTIWCPEKKECSLYRSSALERSSHAQKSSQPGQI